MRRFSVLIPFALAAVIAGCGSSGSSSSSSSPAGSSTSSSAPASTGSTSTAAAAPSSGGSSSVSLSETEYKITPATSTAKAGKITFQVQNSGQVTHALAIQTPSGLKATSSIAPGSSATLSVDLKAGKYTYYCPVPGHRGLGMVGTLTVS